MKHIQRIYGDRMVYLNIGQGLVCAEPTAVTTVLGSCVAVTFFSRARSVGGTFHSLLPSVNGMPDPGPMVFKFVDQAIAHMVRILATMGLPARHLECKVFGGANALFTDEMCVGRKNVEVALACLARHNLRVAASDVGGSRGRKLLFLTDTGEVFIKRLGKERTTACARPPSPGPGGTGRS